MKNHGGGIFAEKAPVFGRRGKLRNERKEVTNYAVAVKLTICLIAGLASGAVSLDGKSQEFER